MCIFVVCGLYKNPVVFPLSPHPEWTPYTEIFTHWQFLCLRWDEGISFQRSMVEDTSLTFGTTCPIYQAPIYTWVSLSFILLHWSILWCIFSCHNHHEFITTVMFGHISYYLVGKSPFLLLFSLRFIYLFIYLCTFILPRASWNFDWSSSGFIG
jgi:hypothetical protein